MAILNSPRGPLVTAEWLQQHLNHPAIVVLDASLKQTQNKVGPTEQASLQIKNARFFDIENVFSDKQRNLPHMLPSPEDFTREVQKLGINQDSIIVVYDNKGIYSSPRVWWMFQVMGHSKVYVLDGGLPHWIAAGYPSEPITESAVEKGNFIPSYNPKLVSTKENILAAIDNDSYQIIDARPTDRFYGNAPEPRPGLRSGHIPSAINIPFASMQTAGLMLQKTALEKIFNSFPLQNKHLIFSCGSGVTACITALGAQLAGHTDFSVYDGSWSEWGASADLPVVTGNYNLTS